MDLRDIATLDLHDATLVSVQLDWPKRHCRFVIRPVSQAPSQPHSLDFCDVTLLHIPQQRLWGRSVSINSASFDSGVVAIEMQSGDVIEITATSVSYGAL